MPSTPPKSAPLAHEAKLSELHRMHRYAPVVWLALCDIARERRDPEKRSWRQHCNASCTRAQIAKKTGITRLQSISAALTALHNANWIGRNIVPLVVRGERCSMIRIALYRSP